jgi:hypothetical protein
MTLPKAITIGILDSACRSKKNGNEHATSLHVEACVFFVEKRDMEDFASHTSTVSAPVDRLSERGRLHDQAKMIAELLRVIVIHDTK